MMQNFQMTLGLVDELAVVVNVVLSRETTRPTATFGYAISEYRNIDRQLRISTLRSYQYSVVMVT